MNNNEIFLCSISNIESGGCGEDCKFCTQSIKYNTQIDKYKNKNIDDIVSEAKFLSDKGALGFCLVTAGKGLNNRRLKYVSQTAERLKKELPNLNLIACNGTATVEQLKILKDSGIDSYNHNLETSEKFYPQICTTHSWAERYKTCENVKTAGLKLCTGGIVGLGETEQDREEFFNEILSLKPNSIPVNFYHYNSALPIPETDLKIEDGLKIIKNLRAKFNGRIMIAGGRESFFKENDWQIFEAGANSIVIGNYLTTRGVGADRDLKMLNNLNLKIAKNCK